MTEFTNGYFQMMHDIIDGYEKAKALRAAETKDLIARNDREGLRAWNDREEGFKFPFSKGYTLAYQSWLDMVRFETGIITVGELPWEEDVHDFVSCYREAAVSEFAIVTQSPFLTASLHYFSKEGCNIKGLCEVTFTDYRLPKVKVETRKGILMSL